MPYTNVNAAAVLPLQGSALLQCSAVCNTTSHAKHLLLYRDIWAGGVPELDFNSRGGGMIKKTKDHSLKVRELIILQWVFEGPSHELRYCWTRFWDFARRLMRITYFFKPFSQISSSTPPKVIQNYMTVNISVKNLPFWLRGVEILACRLQKTRQIHWKNWHVQNWPSILNERCKHFKKNLSFYDEFLKVPFTNCDTVERDFEILLDVSRKTPTSILRNLARRGPRAGFQ